MGVEELEPRFSMQPLFLRPPRLQCHTCSFHSAGGHTNYKCHMHSHGGAKLARVPRVSLVPSVAATVHATVI